MNSLAGRGPILITGASGFIGSHLARRLVRGGDLVIGTCTSPVRANRLRDMPANFILATADMGNPAALQSLFAAHRFGTVFHLAACGVHEGTAGAADMLSVNAAGSLNLAQIALRHRAGCFVYCGSGLEYESLDAPVCESAALSAPNLYGASKVTGWLLLDYLRRVEGLPLTTVRPFTVFGPAESEHKLIPYAIGRALRREPLRLTAGTQIRDYVYVSDVVEALILAAASNTSGAIFNIGAGTSGARTVRQIIETTMDLAGAPRSLCHFGEARRSRPDPRHLVANPTRAINQLGWRPRISLEEGLLRTIQSMTVSSVSVAAA